jgi:hypothetical protein
MERDWEFSSKSIHKIRKSRGEWNGIGDFYPDRFMSSQKPGIIGSGLEISIKIDP